LPPPTRTPTPTPDHRQDDGGDHALELHEFLAVLVLLSFFRANPRFGEAGRKDAAHPLPGCLEQMLTKSVLKKAKQDTLGKVKKMIEKSMDVKAVLREHAPKLKREFDRLTPNRQGANQRGSARPTLMLDQLVRDLTERGVCRDAVVRPTPAVRGMVLPEVHTSLSVLDVRGAFVTSQAGIDELLNPLPHAAFQPLLLLQP
jgi:hypothetical protein